MERDILAHFSNKDDSTSFNEAVKVLTELLNSEDIYSVEKAFAVTTAEFYKSNYKKRNKLSLVEGGEKASKEFFKNFDKEKAYTQSPPGSEHYDFYNKNGKPYSFLSQPYSMNQDTLKAILSFCSENDLEVSISNHSSYWYPSQTLSVEFRVKNH